MKGRFEAFLRKTTLTHGLVTSSIREVGIVAALTSAFSTFRLRCKRKLTLDVFLAEIADASGHCRNNMVFLCKCPTYLCFVREPLYRFLIYLNNSINA